MVTVRDATERDSRAIAGLLTELGYPTGPAEIPPRLTRMLAEPGQSVLVAEDDGEVIGLATVIVRHLIHRDAPFARLSSLVVTERQRSQGVGRELVEAAAAIAREAGCQVIEVTSSEHRTRAAAFYGRLGFVEKRRRFTKAL